MFLPEPPFAHDRIARVGVLLVNLGTPDAPTPAAVRRYLAQFLSDPRVVEIPSFAWQPVLHAVVLRTRPAKSAARYASIWTRDGSPLAIHTNKQKVLLSGYLGARLKALGLPADQAIVEQAMRYGNPPIGAAIDRLRNAGCERLLVVPLYPQYAASTTGSVVDAVAAHLLRMRRVPALRIVDTFHDDPGYISALAATVNDYWTRHGQPEHLVLSFHGLPRRSLSRGDPYHCLCQATGRLLARELGLDSRQWTLAFQSRFGRGRWLEPYTSDALAKLGATRPRRVDVVAPGFVSDCLETLEELALGGKRTFQAAGGGDYEVIPCLNEHPRWIAALADIVLANLQGWLAPPPGVDARESTLLRARAQGAKA
jgi:protoporphyrin/coproporphyrin ferrochelatase